MNTAHPAKRLALEVTRDLWTWIAGQVQPVRKSMWPGWTDYGYSSNLCACCDFDSTEGTGDCDKCPLLNHWPDTCVAGNTDYSTWVADVHAGRNNHSAARSIANAAIAALQVLDAEEAAGSSQSAIPNPQSAIP
jgi:hypothetical protein